MNIEIIASQIMENIIADLMFAFDLERDMAERISCTVICNPKLAVELEEAVKAKRCC